MLYDLFVKSLPFRLKQRADTFGGAYYLDLRLDQFRRLGRIAVRQAGGRGWETTGPTTQKRETAEEWLQEPAFIQYVWQQYQARMHAPNLAGLTTREAAERYVRSLLVTRRDANSTEVIMVPEHLKSRVSVIRRHVVPALGHIRLSALTRAHVRAAIDGMLVERSATPGGPKRKVPAARGSKLQFKRALLAIWAHNLPDMPAPFLGIRITSTKAARNNTIARLAAVARSGAAPRPANGALTSAELVRAIVAAMQYDMEMGARKNLTRLYVAETVFAVVLQAATGVRISELLTIMWGHIREAEGHILIYNAKQEQLEGREWRAVPYLDSLRPWIAELRALRGGAPADDELVIRSHPADYRGPKGTRLEGDPAKATQNTIGNKIAKALRRAGLKVPKKATHGLRSSFFSLMTASGEVEPVLLKGFMGHQVIFEGSSDRYLAQLIEAIRPAHRRALALPTPDEVRRAAASFTPSANWKLPKKKEDRSAKGKAASQARRLARKPLGVSLGDDAAESGADGDVGGAEAVRRAA